MSPLQPVTVTVVESPACHFCEDAKNALAELASHVPITVAVVRLDTAEGRALVAEHRPPMSPLVLVQGRYFSSGRLPRKKLLRHLESLTAAQGSSTTAGAV